MLPTKEEYLENPLNKKVKRARGTKFCEVYFLRKIHFEIINLHIQSLESLSPNLLLSFPVG